jgi:aryl-alcohol dehydrogenase-like predicted oxidoreductase
MTMTTPWSGTRRLGRSGLEVSALGLGCWAIGGAMARGDDQLGYAGVDDDEARRAITRGVELGVTLLDTADVYGAGHSEYLLGETVGNSDSVRIATKFGNVFDEQTRQLTGADVTPGYVRTAAQESLRRLRRDRIDLYQLHHSDVTSDQAADIIAVLEELVDAGSIAWWGISTDDPAVAKMFTDGPHCTAMQVTLNVLDDSPELLQLCADHDLAVLCKSPLAMGLLGGRYTADSVLPADDIRTTQPDWLRWFTDGRPTPEFLDRIARVRETLTGNGRSLAQGALAWILSRSDRTIPLPGFRNPKQIEDNTGALTVGPLSDREYADVEAALGRVVNQDQD